MDYLILDPKHNKYRDNEGVSGVVSRMERGNSKIVGWICRVDERGNNGIVGWIGRVDEDTVK